MSAGYLSAHTEILMANGLYKNISKVQPGDTVFNMRMEPIKVQQIVQTTAAKMNEVRYTNWYMPLYATPELQILTCTPGEKTTNFSTVNMDWTPVSKLTPDVTFTSEVEIYQHLLPLTFSIKVTTPEKEILLTPSHKLGLLLGLYTGYGSVVDNVVELKFGPNDELVEQAASLLQELLHAKTLIKKEEFCYKVRTKSSHVIEFFAEFGNKIERQLPQKFWSNNSEYVRGLFEGLIEYEPEADICRYIPVTHNMAQVFLWVCALMGLSFSNDTPTITESSIQVYPLFLKLSQENTGFGHFTGTTDASDMNRWNLIVECPTASFVANNMVVKALPIVN